MIAALNRWCRRIPLLDRWLVGEILAPLLFAVAAFTVVGLSIGVMFELVRRLVEDGLPAWTALQVMLLSLPRFLVLSFPMATLFATLLAYSKLTANSELTALRSVGVSTVRLVVPALVLSALLTRVVLLFNDVIVLKANTQAEVTLQKALGPAWHGEGQGHHLSRFGRVRNRVPSAAGAQAVVLFPTFRQGGDGGCDGAGFLKGRIPPDAGGRAALE